MRLLLMTFTRSTHFTRFELALVTVFVLTTLPSFSQKLEKITLFDGKVELMVPKRLSEMSDEMWALKYRSRERPPMVLTDEDGEINLIATGTNQPADESQMSAFVDFQLAQLKQQRPDLIILDQGIKTVKDKKIGYFKFLSQAEDQKVFNYYFFTILDGKVIMFTFNCIRKLQGDWEDRAEAIVSSLQVK